MWDIHDCPIVALNWIVDEDDEIKSVLNDFVNSGFDPKCSRFFDLRHQSDQEYKDRLAQSAQYGDPPPSVTFNSTASYLDNLGFSIDPDVKAQLLRNQESLVYLIGMTKEKCKRQDPYTRTQFIYDYAYCRSGKLPEQKNKNLILHFPSIRKSVWERKNPNDSNTKSSNWHLVANAFIFSDGIEVLR